MSVLRGLEQVPAALRGCVLTIGNFDGVHRGHQQIIAQAAMLAAPTRIQTIVLTFEPHPLQVVAPQRAPAKLMPLEERTRRLLGAGADVIVIAHSNPELLSLPAAEFVEQILVEKFAPRYVVEGQSFGFGRGRTGTVQLLQSLGPQLGFEVFIVGPLRLDLEAGKSVAVSSSLIRRLLLEGQVYQAQLCLGRPYALFGVVCRGHARGRGLGFPTVNLSELDQLIPAEGVYAGRAAVRGREHLAAISIGTVPTFGEGSVQVEAHLLDFEGDLYDEPIRLDFVHFLRVQQKFPAVEDLRRQIEEDVARVRTLSE